MILLSLEGKKYKLRNNWQDLTIADIRRAMAVVMPDEVSDQFEWFEHLAPIKQQFAIFTDLNPLEIDLLHPSELVYYFVNYMLPLLNDLQSEVPTTYTPELIDKFVHDGVTYLMPTNLNIGEELILQHGQTARPFVEASNVLSMYSKMKRKGVEVLPLFVASVVKQQEGEQWDEAKIAERAKRFETLPMHYAWEVFFCILQRTLKLKIDILLSMQEIHVRNKKTQVVDSSRGYLQRLLLALQEILTRWRTFIYGDSLRY